MSGDDVDAGTPAARAPETRTETSAQGPWAWRLTFEHDASGIRLVGRERVAMLAPPDDSELTYAARSGYWVEVKDAQGRGVYRQILHDPLRGQLEVHSREPGQHPTRVDRQTPAVVFEAVVPDLPEGSEVVLKGQPTMDAFESEAAVPLVREPLREPPPADPTQPRARDERGGER